MCMTGYMYGGVYDREFECAISDARDAPHDTHLQFVLL